jgi:hypothetical protein
VLVVLEGAMWIWRLGIVRASMSLCSLAMIRRGDEDDASRIVAG